MPNVKVHRGLKQIGGCITEISTSTSRVFIDFGQNLPGSGETTTPKQDKEMVDSIFSANHKEHEAVIYSHAHEDHVGLFKYIPDDVPQYIGEGGKLILIAKYDLIRESHKLNLNVSKGLNHQDSVQRIEAIIETDNEIINKLKSFRTWERTKPRKDPESFSVGDIRITPFFNCHSIYDSYMFLIEADGKRIWHTGDYREHGYLGKGLFPTLRKYATDIDILITEGTTLKRGDECIHESEVSRKMACVMDAFKYVVVLASSTDIERLAGIKEAAKKAHKPLYICGGNMRRTMNIFTKREAEVSKGLFEFHPRYVTFDDPKIPLMQKNGFVLIAGTSQLGFVKELCEDLNQEKVLCIYSSWDGYYKIAEQVEVNPMYKEFRDSFHNVVDIHTSGHASRETIKKVIETVKPKEVICIHKEADAEL